MRVLINGERVDADEAKVSVFDRGFLFGDAVYDVIATRDGRLQQREAEKSGDFIIPDNLKPKATDSDKVKEQKKKKIKALKYNHRIDLQKKDANAKQNSWLNFNSKGIKKGSGHFKKSQKEESIFKTSESSKVGVTGFNNISK